MRLIGFTGKMGSGKSTAIGCLKEIQKAVVNVKFAQPLYDIQEAIYHRIKLVYKRPDDFIKDRKLLQFLGTDWGRNSISTTIWVDLWKEDVKYCLENYRNSLIVCDDVRFNEEADAIKQLGGIVIQIESAQQRTDTSAGIAGHPSEQGIDLDKVDYIIDNNGTIDDLRSSLLTINAEKALW